MITRTFRTCAELRTMITGYEMLFNTSIQAVNVSIVGCNKHGVPRGLTLIDGTILFNSADLVSVGNKRCTVRFIDDDGSTVTTTALIAGAVGIDHFKVTFR